MAEGFAAPDALPLHLLAKGEDLRATDASLFASIHNEHRAVDEVRNRR